MRLKMNRSYLSVIVLTLCLFALGKRPFSARLHAQDAEPAPTESEQETETSAEAESMEDESVVEELAAAEADPYATLLEDAVSQKGVLTVHQVDGQWYWELPADQPAISNPTTLNHVNDLLAEIDAILTE